MSFLTFWCTTLPHPKYSLTCTTNLPNPFQLGPKAPCVCSLHTWALCLNIPHPGFLFLWTPVFSILAYDVTFMCEWGKCLCILLAYGYINEAHGIPLSKLLQSFLVSFGFSHCHQEALTCFFLSSPVLVNRFSAPFWFLRQCSKPDQANYEKCKNRFIGAVGAKQLTPEQVLQSQRWRLEKLHLQTKLLRL